MAIAFVPAVRTGIGLIVGLMGSSGSGKTFSALELATGLAGGKRFAVIDTEAGRALHYASSFAFDHGDLGPPFTPQRYTDAILAAEAAHYPVIVLDSQSHEWAGEGGILEWHEEELQRMAGNDWQKREACKMAAWVRPKMAHKKMVARLLQIRAHLILCMRAEEKVDMVRDPTSGKMQIVPKVTRTGLDGWVPIKLEQQHRPFFPLSEPITRKAGELLAEWAAGGAPGEKQIKALIADYANCKTQAEFKALEKRREALWTKSTSAVAKRLMSEASKATSARLKSGATSALTELETAASWISMLAAAGSLEQLEAAWRDCNASYRGEPPPDSCLAAYESAQERLGESEGRQLDL
jgi:AAA domain